MSPARSPIAPPDLAGYRYLDHIGLGGFSDVFLYEREFPRQKVAVKVLLTPSATAAERERFTAEANAMASLTTHPYIVSIYEAAISPEGYPYLVMEHYPRPNFNVRARTERFSVPAVLRAGVQVAAAVETAHRIGVLHRDIKPANILTSEYGRPGLTDFGIAAAHTGPGEASGADAEAEGMSIPWSPPEVLAGSTEADVRTDIYSLGATLYTLLAGRSPFEIPGDANRSIDLIDRIARQPVPKLDRPEVPPALVRLLERSMAKNPADRPASAAEFARALQVIEVDQRFDMTPFEVSEEAEAPSPGEEIDADAGATRVKGPAVIEAQAPLPAAPAAKPTPIDDVPVADETISRSALRRAKVEPTPTAPATGLISSTPYRAGVDVPRPTGAVPGGPAGPRRPVTLPAASDYSGASVGRVPAGVAPPPVLGGAVPPGAPTAPETPGAAAGSKRPKALLALAIGVPLLVIAVVIGIVVLGSKDDATPTPTSTTRSPSGGSGTPGPLRNPLVTPRGQNGTGYDWTFQWAAPRGTRSTDVVVIQVGSARPVKAPDPTKGSYRFTTSSDRQPCVVAFVRRAGQPDSASVEAGRC